MASQGMAPWVRDGSSSRVHPRIQHLAIHTAEPTGAAGWLINKTRPGGPRVPRPAGWPCTEILQVLPPPEGGWAPSSRPQFQEEGRKKRLRGGANFLPGPCTWAPVGAAITRPCPLGTPTHDPITTLAPAE